MVTRLLLFSFTLLALTACEEERPKKIQQHAEFDAEQFDLGAFTGRVQHFLQSRRETQGYDDYEAVFVNTKGCSGCVRGAFDGIRPFLANADHKVFIYANDSSLLELVPENAHLQFVCIPVETFHANRIFHNKIYLYTVHNGGISPLDVTLEAMDSLNRVN